MNKVIAVLCSDLHLQERAPVARSAEPDWFEAMARPIRQLRELANAHNVPVVCAGDVFDYWKAPPEVINFALDELPEMYAVPGQHDLPYHAMKDIGRSALGTLITAGKVKLLTYRQPTLIRGAYLWGYGWGSELYAPERFEKGMHVAVIHAFAWTKNTGFPGAPEKARVGAYCEAMAGFDVLLFGDNHKPFLLEVDGMTVFNHGGFMRRKSNERDLAPAFGLLMSDGTVKLHKQDVSKDKFLDVQAKVEIEEDQGFLKQFLSELGGLENTRLDFVDAVKHYLKSYECTEGAKKLILEAIHRSP